MLRISVTGHKRHNLPNILPQSHYLHEDNAWVTRGMEYYT